MYRADVSPVSQNVSAKIMQIEDNTKEKPLKLSFFVLCGPVVLVMICVGTFMSEGVLPSIILCRHSSFFLLHRPFSLSCHYTSHPSGQPPVLPCVMYHSGMR